MESSNTASLNRADDVQVVDERAPSRVGVEYNVGEADWAVPVLRKQGEVSAVRSVHALGPEGQPLRVKVAIKVTIRVRPPVVTPPAVRVNPYTPLSRRRLLPERLCSNDDYP